MTMPFLHARYLSHHPTNSIRALKAKLLLPSVVDKTPYYFQTVPSNTKVKNDFNNFNEQVAGGWASREAIIITDSLLRDR